MGCPRLSVGESMLLKYTHAHKRTVIYGLVIVSRNLERANENEGFQMTALELTVSVEDNMGSCVLI